MIRLKLFKNTFRQGIIMGISFCLYTTLMWLTKLDTTYLNIGQYLDGAIIILPIIMVFWAIRQEHDAYTITIIERIVIAVHISFISYIIYDPFLYIYHEYINPEWFNAVLELKNAELQAADISKDKITDTLQKMKEINITQSGLFRPSTWIPSVFIIPILLALISIVFIRAKKKKKEKTSKQK